MLRIYRDRLDKDEVTDHSLIENHEYFLNFEHQSDFKIRGIIAASKLAKFIDWLPGNTKAKLKITNFIGKIRLLDQEYDVRSAKFLMHLTGVKQLQFLLDDLKRLVNQASFTFMSPTMVNRDVDWSRLDETELNEFNYFYQIFCTWPATTNINALFESVKRHPNSISRVSQYKGFFWNINKVTYSVAKNIVSSQGEAIPIGALPNSPFSSRMKHFLTDAKAGNIPLRIDTVKGEISLNTPENQFIKFFFRYVEVICRKIKNSRNKFDAEFLSRADELLKRTQRYLCDPFFVDVDDMTSMTSHSTVLANRHGYKEIYEHYIKAKFGVLHIYQEYLDALTVDLKDIATLYEMWCFYKMAISVLGSDIQVEESGTIIDGGELKYRTTLKNRFYSVSYNKTFKRGVGGSYSLELRPDVVVVRVADSSVYLFDAKYRVKNIMSTSGEVVKQRFQETDIHKMHTYLDAIEEAKSSIALYVGNQFAFFEKGYADKNIDSPLNDFELNGVGALPLVPGSDDKIFEEFCAEYFP